MYKQRESALTCSRLMQVFGDDAEHPVTVEAIRKRAASLLITSKAPPHDVLELSRTSGRRARPRPPSARSGRGVDQRPHGRTQQPPVHHNMDSRDGQRREAEPQVHVAPLSLRESEEQLPSARARALRGGPKHKAGDDDEAPCGDERNADDRT